MLEALLFDVDGTIAETEDLHRRAFNAAFGQHGIPLEWDAAEYRRLLAVTGGRERIARALAERRVSRPAVEIAAVHATKTAAYAALVEKEGAPWRPGVARLMSEARRANVRVGIVTTTSEANLAPLLSPVLGPDWRAHFATVVCGEAVARKKPAPDAYREALWRLRLPARACVAFEDSASGVAAAHAAGCTVVATRSEWLGYDDLSRADLQLWHLGDAGALWDEPHPLLGRRWLALRDLAAWHARRRTARMDDEDDGGDELPRWPGFACEGREVA